MLRSPAFPKIQQLPRTLITNLKASFAPIRNLATLTATPTPRPDLLEDYPLEQRAALPVSLEIHKGLSRGF